MPAPIVISFKLRDDEDFTTSVPIYYDGAEVDTLAKAAGVASSLAPLISAVTGCGVVGAEVTYPLTVPADTVDNNSRADAGATLSFYNEVSKAFSLYIPGFINAYIVAGVVDARFVDEEGDPSPNNVGILCNALTAGTGVTGGYAAVDGNNLDLSAYRGGKQATRRALRTK